MSKVSQQVNISNPEKKDETVFRRQDARTVCLQLSTYQTKSLLRKYFLREKV